MSAPTMTGAHVAQVWVPFAIEQPELPGARDELKAMVERSIGELIDYWHAAHAAECEACATTAGVVCEFVTRVGADNPGAAGCGPGFLVRFVVDHDVDTNPDARGRVMAAVNAAIDDALDDGRA